ncbi:MAG: glutamate synthase-related protein, partial [Fimbriimonadaceae bacterium]|nr:glutamate synthase-related protein [Fimbriimonadaceae bacterium]
LSDAGAGEVRAALPSLRTVSRVHEELIRLNRRQRIGLVCESGLWDIHQAALHLAMGADLVNPWLGCLSVGEAEAKYLKGLRAGVLEAMSMIGITPSSAYCGSRLAEAIGLDRSFLASEFPGVPGHLEGIGAEDLDREWHGFHQTAFADVNQTVNLVDAGEYRHTRDGRPHANNALVVRHLQSASGYSSKSAAGEPGSRESFAAYTDLIRRRPVTSLLDCLEFAERPPIPLDEVEPVQNILWRFMAPGMSEGALSEPAHRAVARSMNILHRLCLMKSAGEGVPLPPGVGPIANSGEGGFDKDRIGTADGNRSIQYAGGRFTITPMTAARADEAEIKFAQGAKPGKGGQLPGRKVSPLVAQRRGCNPGYELVSPPINHNLYSIEDVKLMLESWRHLNQKVSCALKYVATTGIEMVCLGGVNAGATRLHISDGSGGTGAAKRVDQKHAGAPAMAVLPRIHDTLIENGSRHLVELSVDGGIQHGDHALKMILLGADRVGFGTNLLISIGCSMLRKCHLAGPLPNDPTGTRRLGCAPGVATQDPLLVAKFSGKARHIARMLWHTAHEMRETMAGLGIRSLGEVVGDRTRLQKRSGLTGKAARLKLDDLLAPGPENVTRRSLADQFAAHTPGRRTEEIDAAERAMAGETVRLSGKLTNESRCVGVQAAGEIARARGDLGLDQGRIIMEHEGAAGHFYAAYSLPGMEYRMRGLAADSCWTGAYGGRLILTSESGESGLGLVGNAFGYGARGGSIFIAGRAGNRFGICLRRSHEGEGPQIVVEGVEANAFQYMTGGTALVLGSVGLNLGSGMTGGTVYLLLPPADSAEAETFLDCLNQDYVAASPLDSEDQTVVRDLLKKHLDATGSRVAERLIDGFDPARFVRVQTRLQPEPMEFMEASASEAKP